MAPKPRSEQRGSITNLIGSVANMKRIHLLIVTSAFAAVSLSSFAASTFARMDFKLFSIQQDITNQMTGSTNETSSSTNISQTSLWTTRITTINNRRLLYMLSNSFNMTWPPGAVLKMDRVGDFDVVSGSNVVKDVSSVLFEIISNNFAVYAGTTVDKTTLTKNGSSATETYNYAVTTPASLVYDDSALTTANGKTTRLTVNGIERGHVLTSRSNTSETFSAVLSFTGTGYGSISNAVSNDLLILGGTYTRTMSEP